MNKEIDLYISSFESPIIKERLLKVFHVMDEELPGIPCVIHYGIPTFRSNKNIIHFGAFKKHIGIYPGPPVIEQLADELSGYACSKGAIQLPHNQPLPIALVQKITRLALELHKQPTG